MDEEKKDAQVNDQCAVPEEGGQEAAQEPQDEVAALRAQVEEYKDRYLRSCAEMDNMRKRLARERQDIVKYGTEKLLKDFLLVYDAIEKSIHSAVERHPDDEPLIQGLRMTEKLFLETLKKNQVEPIEAKNVPFDPRYHEALMQINREDMQKGMVLDELEKGFMVHDRVLRPAKVTVSG
ncbi:MAG TPA: nucleotide exchange factor GrpE [Deltaproteobacteria bacterium]|jgi:molecular chaperone GrpE|nr:nucleotide exchange factor GrpE [Deltaproteobacteria bacterium]HOI05861.1 nucleotide exchange factor GrpE [Deltaproteobacteria bacterium]